MEVQLIIQLAIVFIYGIFLLIKQHRLKGIITSVSLILIQTISFYILKQQVSIEHNIFILLVIETVILFTLLQFEIRVNIIFLLLFIASIGIVTFLSFKYEGFSIYAGYITLFIFFLAENNQIFMRKTYEESATEFQNKILQKQVEEVQNIYLTMRSWRHDYHNHLQKLKAHITMNQIKEANQYLDELEVDLDHVNQLVETGNLNLDAILNSKLSLALKYKIDLNFKASVPKKLTISDIDLCVLIGNLIDNAVEACVKMDEPKKFIRVYIGIFKQQLYISVANSTNEVIRKLDAEYITNKRGNHGHGLKRINNIVKKYGGFINRQNEPAVFVTEVLLPL